MAAVRINGGHGGERPGGDGGGGLHPVVVVDSPTVVMVVQEKLLQMNDLAHRMGRRALGVGDTSE